MHTTGCHTLTVYSIMQMLTRICDFTTIYGRFYDAKDRPLCFADDVSFFFIRRVISEVLRPIASKLSYMLESECNLRKRVRYLGSLAG